MAVLRGCYGDLVPEYEGRVLYTYEHNGYDDSDWYAVCWDEDKQELVHVEYDSTRAAGGGWAEIDVTKDCLRQIYRKYFNDCRESFDSRLNAANAKKVCKGDMVSVIKGRKIKIGTVCKCFWIGTRYNPYSRQNEERVGLEIDGERVFISAGNVQPVEWKKRMVHGMKRKHQIQALAIECMPAMYRHCFNMNRM